MKQVTYEQEEKLAERQIKPKNFFIMIGVIGTIIVIAIIITIFANIAAKNNNCTDMETLVGDAAIEYIGNQQIALTVVNPTTTVDIKDLLEDGFLTDVDMMIKDNICAGEVKITKVGDNYITTPDLTNCDYCTTATRYGDWSKPTDKIPNADIIDVNITYNYVEKSTNYTSWSSYYTPAQLEKDPITSHEDKRLVSISPDAKNIEIISEDKNYYRYQDQRWKFYRYNDRSYSDFSSTEPAGYPNKDTATAKESDWSEWSLNSPDVADYRKIEKKTGYRWYYMDEDEKIFYNSGAYVPTEPDDVYTEREEDDSATVYRYKDTSWRWYSGEKRMYSSYMVAATASYPYKDEGLTTINNFSGWSDSSSITDENRSYRTEEIEVRKRFRTKYDIYSFNKLDEYVEANEFESSALMTMQEVYDSADLELIVKYEYISKK